jgi:hypothetical protein
MDRINKKENKHASAQQRAKTIACIGKPLKHISFEWAT